MEDFRGFWGALTPTFPRYVGELISDAEADVREDDSYLFDLDNKVWGVRGGPGRGTPKLLGIPQNSGHQV